MPTPSPTPLAAMSPPTWLAARARDQFASLRFKIAEIAARTKNPDTTRELRDALADAKAASHFR